MPRITTIFVPAQNVYVGYEKHSLLYRVSEVDTGLRLSGTVEQRKMLYREDKRGNDIRLKCEDE